MANKTIARIGIYEQELDQLKERRICSHLHEGELLVSQRFLENSELSPEFYRRLGEATLEELERKSLGHKFVVIQPGDKRTIDSIAVTDSSALIQIADAMRSTIGDYSRGVLVDLTPTYLRIK